MHALCIIFTMTLQWQPESNTHTELNADALHTVLVCDVVESVRWMQANEAAAVAQWQAFAEAIKTRIAPQYGGRIVKSLGDGLMLDFAQQPAVHAVNAAFAMLNIAKELTNTPAIGDLDTRLAVNNSQFHLRIGVHHTPVTVGDGDIYGNGVNLAARIATLAGPGEVIITAEMRDQLTDQLDADIEDVGECYLKHLEEPVRVYRLSETTGMPQFIYREAQSPSRVPKIAVIAPVMRLSDAKFEALGELIADNVIANLSQSPKLHVISRFSTSKLRDKNLATATKAQYLDADYILTGSYHLFGEKVMLQVELVKVNEDRVVWADRHTVAVTDLFEMNSEVCMKISQCTQDAIFDFEVKNALIKPLPNLQSYSLFLSGAHLIHQASPSSFERGGAILEHLSQRHPRSAHARTWNATLHMLRTTRGLATDIKKEASMALRHTYEALTIEPQNALALATEGIVHCQLKDDPETGYQRLNAAVNHDPSCALGWLYLSTVQSLRGNFAEGAACGARAVSLSPIDPQDYFYYSLWGTALLANGESIKARDVLLKSVTKNRYHAPTVRMLIVAYIECNQGDFAREWMTHLLAIQPNLSADKYIAQSKANMQLRQRYMLALVDAGLPMK